MGAPIVIPQKQTSPWAQLLPQMFFMKIQHNQEMEKEKLAIERKKAEKEADRKYTEGRDETKAATSKQTQIELENLRTQNDILLKGGYEVPPPQAGTSIQPTGSSQSVPTTSGGSIQKIGNRYMFVPKSDAYKQGQIMDFKVGDEIIQHKYENGKWVPTGVKAPRYKPTTTINTNVNTQPLQKSTQTQLEEDIITGEKNLDMMKRLDTMYNPSFLEYTGKGQAFLEDIGSKMGISKGEYLQKRAKWASEVDAFTLKWRKYITGVAGGKEEMKSIEQTVINTKYDSPAKYKAKREQMEIMTKAAIAKDKAYLAKGIDLKKMTPKFREIISKADPLENYYPTASKGIEALYNKYGLEE